MEELTGFIHLLGAAVVAGTFIVLWFDEHPDVFAAWRSRRPRRDRGASGMTLVELLVVLALIAIVSTIYVVRLAPARATLQSDSDQATAQAVGAALSSYYLANACLPPTANPGVMPTGMTSYVHTWPANLNYNYDTTNSRGELQLLVNGAWVTQLTISGPRCP